MTLDMLFVADDPQKPLQERLKARFPLASVWQGYGMTECSPCVTHQFDESDETLGSIGKLFPGTYVDIAWARV